MVVGAQCQPDVICWCSVGSTVPARCHLLGRWWGYSASLVSSAGMAVWGTVLARPTGASGGLTPMEGSTTERPAEADGEAHWGLRGSTPVEGRMTEMTAWAAEAGEEVGS